MENPYASPSHVDYNPGRMSAGEFMAAICLTLVFAGILAVLLNARRTSRSSPSEEKARR